MKSIRNRLLLLFFLSLSSTGALSSDLYRGEVTVTDELPETRNVALQEILRQVLVRVSGKKDVMSLTGASEVLREGTALVQQFRYRTEAAAGDPDAPVTRVLSARFDPAALHRVMSQHQVPVWLGDRPRVILWVGIEQGGARTLLNLAETPDALQRLQQRADARGMPLQLPLLDLEDRAALTVADLWSGYAPAIQGASARYPHAAIATARLQRSLDGRWAAAWELWWDEQHQVLRSEGESPGEALARGVDLVQDRLALRPDSRYSDHAQLTRVGIEGVWDLAAYTRLLQSLGEIPEIRTLVVLEAGPGRIVLGVQVDGGTDLLAQRLRVQNELQALPGRSVPDSPDSLAEPAQPTDLDFLLISGDR